ncbi:Serpin B6 [Araneus ventricosus]|uniref:Serpin B6 n=1 Tax=Araneus ventricosus TaxID=182803 RepID=A0A4Y2K3W9_ARAVE|nr:Serpin B6 [Araneus ventricosus]
MESQDANEAASTLALADANNYLGLNLYKVLSKGEGNIFFSPFSLSCALAMLFCGTREETAKEMRTVLGYEIAQIKDEDIKSYFQELLHEIEKNPDSYTLTSANSLLCQKGFLLKEEYKSVLSGFFKALFQEADIARENEKAIQVINEWVSEKTHNMIPKLLDVLDPEAVLVFFNAVYFKGFWKYPFDKEMTRLRNFYIKGQKDNFKSVPMMYINKSFSYVCKESFGALELPYIGDDVSMLILLPDSENGLRDLENSLNYDFIQDLKQDMMETRVDVTLPKFRLEFSKSLKESFQCLGLEKVFTTGAQFGGISDTENLLVSEIFHKAIIEVNEEGTEASAATQIEAVPMCMNPDFIVDHPFMFVIYNTQNNLILFMGRIEEL